jgi:hypothetical protein
VQGELTADDHQGSASREAKEKKPDLVRSKKSVMFTPRNSCDYLREAIS